MYFSFASHSHTHKILVISYACLFSFYKNLHTGFVLKLILHFSSLEWKESCPWKNCYFSENNALAYTHFSRWQAMLCNQIYIQQVLLLPSLHTTTTFWQITVCVMLGFLSLHLLTQQDNFCSFIFGLAIFFKALSNA
jgi:hypothetical protein